MKAIAYIKYFAAVLLLLFIAFPNISISQNNVKEGYNKLYYANGKLSSEGTIHNGKPDSYWKTYYESGKIKSEGNRKDFVLDSTWKFYRENGLMYVTFNYRNGKKNGYKYSYSPAPKDSTVGVLSLKENYVNDTLQGTAYYYKTGRVVRTVNYKDGLLEGKAYDFSADSMITTITVYKGGFVKRIIKINQYNAAGHKDGLWQTFYASGNVKWEGTYTDGKRDGYFKTYTESGSLIDIEKYISDVQQTDAPELAKLDVKVKYYPDGKVQEQGPIKNGKPFGVHYSYNDSGQVVKSEVYDSGKVMAEGKLDTLGLQQGEWKEFHDNGQLKSIGKYLNGVKVGTWKYFYPSTKMFETGKYDNQGRQQGKWMWYYDDGKVRVESNYFNGQADGDFIEYSDSGGVITQGQYSEGLREGKWTYQLGNYRSVGKYTDDQQDSMWVEYYIDNNKVRYEGNYNQGRPDGKHVWYYPDGKKQIEGQYILGAMEDKWRYYDELGNLFLTITYKNDIEIKYDATKIEP